MASDILKNNSFGGPPYFDRQWGAPCLGAVDISREQNWAGQVAGEKGGPPSVKVAHVYVVLRY